MTFAHGNRCGPSSPCSRFLRNRSTRRWVRPTTQHPENEAFRHPRISFAVAFEDDPASHHPTGTLSPSHRPSQSTKQTINPLSWRGPCSCHRQGEKQQKGRSSRHFILIPTVPNIQQNRQSTRYLGGDCAVVVEKQRRGEDEDPNGNSSSSSSPPSLAINKTDNRPAILAGTVQLLSTTREAANRKIQTAIHPHPHPHRPSHSTKQTINPLSWQGPCSCCRQGEKQRRRRSKRQFILILIPTVPRNQQNRQSTRYLGGDRAVVVDNERSSKKEDPNSTSSSSPTSLALNKTDNRPAILAGTAHFSTTKATKTTIKPSTPR
ncbi:hypothetical protein MHU86_10610 [Fragilaria crotonensis]|nr:hypothetical protein MHU86_10610 [Fragilaria crotonensis]